MSGTKPVRHVQAADVVTGEITQMAIFEDDTLQRARVRYDWNPFPGRHINVPKALLAKLYSKDSGYSPADRDMLFFYYAFSPDGAEPLRLTFKEMAEILGGRADTIAKRVTKLHAGGFLLEAERVGRMVFYRVNPRAGYDGSATDQVEAVRDARFPVVPAPTTPIIRKKAAS